MTLRCDTSHDNLVRLLISDTGQGIDEKNFEDVFLPFSRSGREASEVEGTGIGLTHSKYLIELMDGSIGFESELNVGSTFF